MREAVDYEYVVDEKDKTSVHIKLLTGEYKDTIFKDGKVGVKKKVIKPIYNSTLM
jgi:hypothetical protein